MKEEIPDNTQYKFQVELTKEIVHNSEDGKKQ